MEDQTILLIIGMIGVFALIGAKMFNPNQAKSKGKTRKDTAEITLDKVNEETITRLSNQLKKEAGRANRLQALKDQSDGLEEQEEISTNQVTFEEITAMVQKAYPKYAFALPFAKDKIMEITKGMTMPQILEYVRQITGNKEPGAADQNSITQEFRSDYA